MTFRPGKTYSMAELWIHPTYGTCYAIWQEDGRTRRKALCMNGTNRATKDKIIAARLLNHFNRALIGGKIGPALVRTPQKFASFCEEFQEHAETTCAPRTCTLYKVALDKALACWGDIPLADVTSRHFSMLLTDMANAGLAVPTGVELSNHRRINIGFSGAVDKLRHNLCDEDSQSYLDPYLSFGITRSLSDSLVFL